MSDHEWAERKLRWLLQTVAIRIAAEAAELERIARSLRG